jgi:hypothetical protein
MTYAVSADCLQPVSDHPKRITWHIIAFFLLAWVYIGWAYIGHHYTGEYSYFFLNYHKYGNEYTCFSIFLFVLSVELGTVYSPHLLPKLTITATAFLWLLTALKEKFTAKETKNSGYSVLPQ